MKLKVLNETQNGKNANQEKLNCSQCDQMFKDVVELTKHFQSVHEGKKPTDSNSPIRNFELTLDMQKKKSDVDFDDDNLENDDTKNRNKNSEKPHPYSNAVRKVLEEWLEQHSTNRCSEDQKKQLAQDTGLTIDQVNNWFPGNLRRKPKPLIDKSNCVGGPELSVYPVLNPQNISDTDSAIEETVEESELSKFEKDQSDVRENLIAQVHEKLKPKLFQCQLCDFEAISKSC